MALRSEIEKFKKWAERNPGRHGEWEFYYPNWERLYSASFEFIKNLNINNLRHHEIEDLIYVIGRDNEAERLIGLLTESEEIFLLLASSAITTNDKDAKWQFAHYLGEIIKRKEEAESLLLKYVQDPNEYVSRRALMALAKIGSSFTEELCVKAWETYEENQRIAVLYSLNKIGSKKFQSYLSKAFDDGRQWLVKNANKYQTEMR